MAVGSRTPGPRARARRVRPAPVVRGGSRKRLRPPAGGRDFRNSPYAPAWTASGCLVTWVIHGAL